MTNKVNKSETITRSPVNIDTRIERPVKHTVTADFQSVTADRKTLLYVYSPIRVVEVQALTEGTTPSAVINLQYSNDTTTFTSLFNDNQTIDSSTTTQYFYPNQRSVPEGFWLWLNVVSVGGTVDHLHLTVIYEQ